MPLTKKGSKILSAMKNEYGADKGKQGTITGTHKKRTSKVLK